MDDLRWVLLISGVLVVLGVVLFGRRKPDKSKTDPIQSVDAVSASGGDRVEPSITADEPSAPDVAGNSDGIAAADDSGAGDDDAIRSVEQKIVTVRIIANDKAPFAGDELVLSLRGIGMRHGRFGIFHRYDGNDENQVVFSAASLVEPGSFELENIKEQKIPGISLFMVLPGPIDGAEAFDQMMAASRTLTQSLGAELLDESGSSLSIQRERYLREEIIQYQLENRIG
ncbi:MAG: cell division protein ZipA C-terminal FtsZ-binding domain-containing protein [Pseudomonadota bacterium]